MTTSDEKFKQLIAELRELIMQRVPNLKNRISALGKRDAFDAEDVESSMTELNGLKKRYTEITTELLELDKVRANLEIAEIIKMEQMLNANRSREMERPQTFSASKINHVWDTFWKNRD